jgi:hypothetical protein
VTKYELTQALADEICEHIGDGKSLRSFCEQEGRPSAPTVCRWLRMEETAWFAEQYARAREVQADALFNDILDIVDQAEDPQIARLRMDARKWMAGKLRPKVYGDKVELGGKVDHEHTHEHRTVSAIDSRIAELLGLGADRPDEGAVQE